MPDKVAPNTPTENRYHLVEGDYPYAAAGDSLKCRIAFPHASIKSALNYQVLSTRDPLPLHELGHFLKLNDLLAHPLDHETVTNLTVLLLQEKLLEKSSALDGWEG